MLTLQFTYDAVYRSGYSQALLDVMNKIDNLIKELEKDYLYTEDAIYAIDILKTKLKELKA